MHYNNFDSFGNIEVPKGNKVVLFTHYDSDGYGAGYQVYEKLKKYDFVHVICSHTSGIDTSSINHGDVVFVTDYSIDINNPKEVNDFQKASQIYWVDHHQFSNSEIKKASRLLPNMKYYVSDDYCATKHIYNLFGGKQDDSALCKLVNLIDDYDTWKKETKECDWLNNYILELRLYDLKNPAFTKLMYDMDALNKAIKIGKELNDIKTDRFKILAKEFSKEKYIEGLGLVRYINNSGNSLLFESVVDSKYVAYCVYSYVDGVFKYSFFCCKDDSALKFCKSHSGGGHIGACGFRSKKNIFA